MQVTNKVQTQTSSDENASQSQQQYGQTNVANATNIRQMHRKLSKLKLCQIEIQ